MKVLVVSNLFPNAQQPGRGIFNKQQISSLTKWCDIQVISPLPWSRNARMKIPFQATIDGIPIYHPLYLAVPKIARYTHGFCYLVSIYNLIKKIQRKFDFDVVYGTWAYPDCYAASQIAKKLGKPFVMRVHGTDINTMHQYAFRTGMVKKACHYSSKVITNSQKIKEKLKQIDVSENKIEYFLNGVDKSLFVQKDKRQAKLDCYLEEKHKHVLFAGNLVEVKGVSYLIKAVSKIENVHLHIIGDGQLKESLKQLASKLSIANRVHFLGRKPHHELPMWFNAADVFCLPSLNEGCPNVLLEALACHTPVVATHVGAIPDMVDDSDKGLLVKPQDADALAEALTTVLNRKDNTMTLNVDSWDDNAKKLYEVFTQVLK